MEFSSILIYFSIGVVVGYIAYRVLFGGRRKVEFIDKSQHREDLILKFIEGKGRVKNDDIQKILRVSDATATRYLQELENQKKIRQVGDRGRFVYYEKIK